MGGLFSTLRAVLITFKGIISGYQALTKRISISPGIPQLSTDPEYLPPYWTVPAASIARHGQDAELPTEVDVVIIGSGITGTSVARALLKQASYRDSVKDEVGQPLKIVMLEARDACSGSTGRNGGHIGPNIYNEYAEIKKACGAAAAQDILRFRLAHISTLLAVAKEENLLAESQARLVDAFDAYMHPVMFANAVEELDAFLKEVPQDIGHGFSSVDSRGELERLQLVSSIVGCISKPGAAIHPYRLVTGILSNLLSVYPNFQLYTHTSCTDIKSTTNSYIVSTPKGELKTKHVVHATNAWSSHLLPGMRGKIIPTRTTMTAQRPGKGLASPAQSNPWVPGSRSYVFYPINDDTVFEYLTQLLPAPLVDDADSSLKSQFTPLSTSAEMMFGGRTQSSFLDNVGVADDSILSFEDQAHLSGALERYFANHWGEEGSDASPEVATPTNDVWGKGRLKAAWSGLIALSADLLPWVGRVPPSVSGRKEPTASISAKGPSSSLTTPGEWISAGYTGEGMVHAWLGGKAVARMILGDSSGTSPGDDTPKLPVPLLITEKRVKEARIENLVDRLGG